MSQTKSKMGLQPTLYQVQLKYVFFALAVVVYSPGVKTCVEYHTAFTDADNDLVVPPGAKEIQFAYKTNLPTIPSKQVFHFELGSAGASSEYVSGSYQPSRAFTQLPYYNKWYSDLWSTLTYEDGFGMHDVGKHQSIFFRFNQPQTVVRIAFGTYSVMGGPTRFSVFASDAENCLDESQWTVLKVVDDNKRFPSLYPNRPANQGGVWRPDGKRMINLPEIKPFRCYGIQVHQVPAVCETDPATSKLKALEVKAEIRGIQMWTKGNGAGAAACDVAGNLVPHETDCEKFYVCTGHGSGFPSKCNGGLQFNKNTITCDWPNNVQC